MKAWPGVHRVDNRRNAPLAGRVSDEDGCCDRLVSEAGVLELEGAEGVEEPVRFL